MTEASREDSSDTYFEHLLSVIELEEVTLASKLSDGIEFDIAHWRATEYEGADRSWSPVGRGLEGSLDGRLGGRLGRRASVFDECFNVICRFLHGLRAEIVSGLDSRTDGLSCSLGGANAINRHYRRGERSRSGEIRRVLEWRKDRLSTAHGIRLEVNTQEGRPESVAVAYRCPRCCGSKHTGRDEGRIAGGKL